MSSDCNENMGRTAQILVIKTLYILYNIYVYLDPSIEVSPLHMHCFKLDIYFSIVSKMTRIKLLKA